MIHALELAHLIYHAYNRFVFFLVNIYYYVLSNFESSDYIGYLYNDEQNTNTSSQTDLLCKQIPSRIPHHIAMAFTHESDQLDLNSIAKLLCWCKQLGVKYITLFDDTGRLKSKQEELYRYFEYRLSLLGYEKPVSYIKGLNILSRNDGRQKFVHDVKYLIEKLDYEDIDLESVQNCAGWTVDPELLISFGMPLCVHGFPPWQLRLTEILSIPTHKNIPQRIFIDCLRRYSKTVQRLGT